MAELPVPYVLLRDVLAQEDVSFLKDACKKTLATSGTPCFSLIDSFESPTYAKIKRAVEACTKDELYYLNDFYLYTDSTFKTNWHMDTELFSFDSAVNAWVLLSPDHVEDPLGFIDEMNDCPERYFHSVKIAGDECTFGDMCTGKREVRSLKEIEARAVRTPKVSVGDILVLNPRRFHKTNVESPKHICSIKFVHKGKDGFLAAEKRQTSTYGQVPAFFWPEVATFNKVVKEAGTWDNVVDGIRQSLKTEEGRTRLSSGFYPEKFDLYRRMVETL